MPNLVHSDFFSFILDDLNQRGYHTDALLKKSQLNRFGLDRSNTFVPVKCMYNLLEITHTQLGIDSFICTFDESLTLQNTQNYGASFLDNTTLLSAAHHAIKYAPYSYTSEQDGLEIKGPVSKFWIRISDPDSKGKSIATELLLGLMLKHIQLACGEDWYPLEIHFPGSYAPDLARILPEGHNTQLYINQPILAVKFPTEILSKRVYVGPNVDETHSLQTELSSLRSKIEKVLDSLDTGVVPTLHLLADLFDIHERSFQRQLDSELISYREIVDQWRFKSALELIGKSDLSILEISQRLGYQKVQNFHRAFRRWTNNSPQKYRDSWNSI